MSWWIILNYCQNPGYKSWRWLFRSGLYNLQWNQRWSNKRKIKKLGLLFFLLCRRNTTKGHSLPLSNRYGLRHWGLHQASIAEKTIGQMASLKHLPPHRVCSNFKMFPRSERNQKPDSNITSHESLNSWDSSHEMLNGPPWQGGVSMYIQLVLS